MALPGADNLLFTPISSLHMTVFQGVIDTGRTEDYWPAGEDRTAPIEAMTDLFLERLRPLPPAPAFKVKVIDILPTGLRLTGATEGDEATLRGWRDALTIPFGYRQDEHDDYHFHSTFAYPTGWIDDADLAVWTRELPGILADLQAAAPTLPLRPPAFCRFADMTHFEELLVLG